MASDPRGRSEVQDGDEGVSNAPFPTKQITILAICRFSEPIAFNSILAYTYVMVKDLRGNDDPNASFYAGLLVSAFPVAEALTAMIWGTISDHYGRKPIALFGLIGVALSCLIFGLAEQYWVAFLARFLGGALNGNVGVMQTMVAEMVKNPAHEPVAYAVQPFVWILGSIVGSAMGGYLAQPAIFYPSIFPEDGLFGRYPYLLPNLVAVACILLAVIQGIFLLEETNPRCIKNGAMPSYSGIEADENERRSLLHPTGHTKSVVESIGDAVHHPVFLEEGLPTTTDQRFDLRRSSFGTIHSIRFSEDDRRAVSQGQLHEEPQDRDDSSNERVLTKPVIMLTTTLVLIAYHQMAFGTILPIQLIDEPSDPNQLGGGYFDPYGGFGYTVHDVGTYMAVSGILALFILGVIFPVFVERVGVWHSFLITVMLYPLPYLMMPFLTYLVGMEPSWLLGLGIYSSMFLQSFFGIISGPCILIFLKNATPSTLVLGKVNGFAMSVTCAARTISPPLVGMIYAQGGSAVAWFSCAGIAVAGCLQLLWVPRTETQVGRVDIEPALKPIKIPQITHNGLEEDAIMSDEESQHGV